MERLQYSKNEYVAEVIASHYGRVPFAFIRCFGCQQNVNDTERLKGVLQDIGYKIVETPEEADLIVFNTCAVREHAEQRVFGNLGALKSLKQRKSGLLLALCGCMGAEKSTLEKLRTSYPYVDIMLGPNPADLLPDMLVEKMTTRKRALRLPPERKEIVEGVPIVRDSSFRAFLPIMYGCDNFCSYCIVPHVRGRERSRTSEDVLNEFKMLIDAGYKEITLLGQNVNSYGKGNEEKVDFSDLLSMLCKVPGDYRIRFMTSHPKDATRKMIDTMVANPQICNHLHLPVQSGSNEILTKMNRRYTGEEYLALIKYTKEVCPEMTFSSDVMVGFPGETQEDFEKTVELVRAVGYTQLFTFIYSKRPGTEAAEMEDATVHTEKSDRINTLLRLQEEAVAKIAKNWLGKTYVTLVENEGKSEGTMQGRMDNNMLVEFEGDASLKGEFITLEITDIKGAILRGKVKK